MRNVGWSSGVASRPWGSNWSRTSLEEEMGKKEERKDERERRRERKEERDEEGER